VGFYLFLNEIDNVTSCKASWKEVLGKVFIAKRDSFSFLTVFTYGIKIGWLAGHGNYCPRP
jgi:hypothetical protein